MNRAEGLDYGGFLNGGGGQGQESLQNRVIRLWRGGEAEGQQELKDEPCHNGLII